MSRRISDPIPRNKNPDWTVFQCGINNFPFSLCLWPLGPCTTFLIFTYFLLLASSPSPQLHVFFNFTSHSTFTSRFHLLPVASLPCHWATVFSPSHRLHLHLTSTPSLHHCRLLISYRMPTQLFEMYHVVFIFSLFEMSYKISLLLPKNSAKFIVLFLFSACLKYHIRSHTVCLNNCLKCTM